MDGVDSSTAEQSEPTGSTDSQMDVAAVVEDFAQVVARFEAPLLRYARQLVGPISGEAEDLVQETFLRLHRYRDTERARDIRHLSTWLYRVTHNLAMDTLRRRARRQQGQARLKLTATTSDPAEQLMEMERKELAAYALRLMRKLPRAQREVLTLKLVESLSIRQIARVIDQPPSNVAYHLNKALRAITEMLKQRGVI